MSSKSGTDDFFGIEYVPSTSTLSTSSDIERGSSDVFSRGSSVKRDAQHLTGTEFIDEQFFPGLSERSHSTKTVPEDEVPPISSSDLPLPDSGGIEEQYFQRVRAAPAQALSLSTERPGSACRKSDIQMMRRNSLDDVPSKDDASSADDDTPEDEDAYHRYNGAAELRARIDPVWNMDKDQLVQFMASRLLHRDSDVIAFDKPYGLAYSGGPSHRPQFDRILQQVKALVAPKVERLYLVKSLDRHVSGVMLFATNKLVQSDIKERMEKSELEHSYRCIVRGVLPDSPVNITIPLIKRVKDGDLKMVPLLSSKMRGDVFHVETQTRTIASNQYCSQVEAKTHNEVAHQVRAHLSLAGTPLFGDIKYNSEAPRPPRLSYHITDMLGMQGNQVKAIPMLMHLREVSLPSLGPHSPPLYIRAGLPQHFVYVLKKLRLLKK